MTHADPDPVVTVLTAPDAPLPPGLEPLHERARVRHADGEASLREHLPSTDILLATDFRSHALENCFDQAHHLAWVHATSAGVDAVMFDAIRASAVTITNARGIFDRAIAEYVLGVILAFAKDTRTNIELQQQRRWQHRDTECIRGKRLLVVGAGSIGRQIARLSAAVGMQVHGTARSARSDDPDFVAVHASAELFDQLALADYVAVAAPLTPQTRGLFNAEAFDRMPAHARFINVGRGPIVDTDALVNVLTDGRIAGAALDVFEQEPLPANHPLWGLDNVLISAHMAGDFIGWRVALSEQFLDNLSRWRAGEPLRNVVDKGRGYVPQQA